MNPPIRRTTALLLAGGLHCAAAGVELTPTWSLALNADISSCAVASTPPAPALLLLTDEGRLHAVDLHTGTPRGAPLAVGRGARFAEPVDDAATAPRTVACVFTRFAAIGVRISDAIEIAWRHGEPVDPQATLPGDPEVLTGWLTAGIVGDTLVLVHRDGFARVLTHADGAERADVPFGGATGRISAARIHASSARCAIVWRCGGQSSVTVFQIASPTSDATTWRVGSGWPIWSTLIGNDVLVADTQGIRIRAPNDAAWRDALAAGDLSAAGIVVLPAVSAESRIVGPRVAILRDEGVETFAVAERGLQRVWRTATPAGLASGVLERTGLGDLRLVSADRAAWLRGGDGTVVAQCAPREDARLIAARVIGDALYGFWRAAPAETDGGVTLSVASPGGARHDFALRGVDWTPRRVHWTASHAVLVGASGVAAIELPRTAAGDQEEAD
jgi:hypothetical protein